MTDEQQAVSRRGFLKVSGVSAAAAGAVLFTGCEVPEKELHIEAPVMLPEDTVSSFENWYASVCQFCPSGCGILARVVEGRVKKIEGNPDHPVNRGKMCPRGLAAPQDLYHPDRVRTPLRRTGPRGSGQYQVITWDDALEELTARLKDQSDQGAANRVLLVSTPQTGLTATIMQRFAQSYGADLATFDPIEQTVLKAAIRRVFGTDWMPFFDISRANYVLSFGANFLESWGSEVMYNRAYGEFRQGRPGSRGYLVQIEPRLSMTGANADEWVPVNPGAEGILALSIANVLVSENLAGSGAISAATGGAGTAAFTSYRPEDTAQATGVPAEKVRDIAHALAQQGPSVVIGGAGPAGHTNGLFNLTAIFALNVLLGNVGRSGGVVLNRAPAVEEFSGMLPNTSFQDWQRLTDRLKSGQPRPVNMLLLAGANPLYGLPNALGFGSALRNVPEIVSFSHILDETSALADLILPGGTFLESWGDAVPDPGPGYEIIGLQQPVVQPFYSTQPLTDVLLQVAQRLGGSVGASLPWQDTQAALKAGMQKVFALRRGAPQAPDFDRFWVRALGQGGWWDTNAPSTPATPPATTLVRQSAQPQFSEGEFILTIFPGVGTGGGGTAHMPWLQMTPDPTTTITWQTWVEMSPEDARAKDIKTEDVVRVRSAYGEVEAIAYVYPAIKPGVVAMPMGQGHSSMGRYAEGRGANPISILAPMAESETGALAIGATRVTIEKTGGRYRLARMEGGVTAEQPEDYSIIQVTDLRGMR